MTTDSRDPLAWLADALEVMAGSGGGSLSVTTADGKTSDKPLTAEDARVAAAVLRGVQGERVLVRSGSWSVTADLLRWGEARPLAVYTLAPAQPWVRVYQAGRGAVTPAEANFIAADMARQVAYEVNQAFLDLHSVRRPPERGGFESTSGFREAGIADR